LLRHQVPKGRGLRGDPVYFRKQPNDVPARSPRRIAKALGVGVASVDRVLEACH
jgi:hypothetical protein